MALITPRNGAKLVHVVQVALNVAGREGVRITTGGTGNAVEVPAEHVAAIEEALGWPRAEAPAVPLPELSPNPIPGPEPEPVLDTAPDPDPAHEIDPEEEQPGDSAPAKSSAPTKKTTSSSRRARRGKEG